VNPAIAAGAVLLLIAMLLAAATCGMHGSRQPLLRWSLLSHRGLRLAMLVYLAVPGVHRQSAGQYPAAAPGRQRGTHGALMLPWRWPRPLRSRPASAAGALGPATVLRMGMILQASGPLLMALLPQPAFALAGPRCCSR
jgi:hypothetical protein